MSHEQRESVRSDPAFRRERDEYRAKRRVVKDERDNAFLQGQLGFTPEQIQQAAAAVVGGDETGDQLAQRQQRLKALARDLNPQSLTFPAPAFTRELASVCAELESFESSAHRGDDAPKAPDSQSRGNQMAGNQMAVPLPPSTAFSLSSSSSSSSSSHSSSSFSSSASAAALVPRKTYPSSSKSNETLQQELEANRSTEKYLAMQKQRARLPAFERQEEIVQAIRDHQVVVISGSTGCGKTTQIPQFVLDAEIAAGRGACCNIICTQPRRISAIGVAERVASEKAEPLGKTVGYQIRLERRACDDTKLLFCTTGILLRRLAGDPLLSGVSHVFLDEVHERNSNSDFSLIILRDLLKVRSDLRVVLMSATLNAATFANYFAGPSGSSVPVPTLHIPGFTFPVQDFYLEDALQVTGHQPTHRGGRRGSGGGGGRRRYGNRHDNTTKHTQEEAQQITEDLVSRGFDQQVVEGVLAFDEDQIDVELIASLCVVLHAREEDLGAVLIFVPGWSDIQKVHEVLTPLSRDRKWKLFPLHGSLPTSQQREIFKPAPSGMRKIVIATNIAESSITIDDVVYVIDTCKHKAKTYDAEKNVACLLPAWVSRASAIQRRGRAGRVQPGKAWHLLPRSRMEDLEEYELPEMLRTPLEQLCLQTRSLRLARQGVGGIKSFMSKAMDQPEDLALDNAMSKLLRIGALEKHDESLTPLGLVLALLPMDPAIGKALVLAAIFGCLEPMLTITAVLSHRTPFVMPLDKQFEADRAKLRFSQGAYSDHRAFVEAYQAWLREERRGNGFHFARHNFLSGSVLKMVRDIREQFRSLLEPTGLVAAIGSSADGGLKRLGADQEWELVKALLVAGLYPNLCRVDEGRHRHKTRFFTRENGKVDLHPASVNSKHNEWSVQRWVTYFDKQRTQGGLFVYDTTVVSSMAIMMFGAGDVSCADGDFYEFAKDGRPTMTEKETEEAGGESGSGSKTVLRRSEGASRSAVMMTESSVGGGNDALFFHEDETINFVATLLHRNGGTYSMSRLSGLLKRQFPAHRQRMGSIRKWVERSEVMCITKPQGSWVISLLRKPVHRNDRVEEDAGPRKTVFFGVEDWIYFRPDGNDSNMEVLRRARRQLRGVVSRRLRRGGASATDVDVRLLNAVRRFVVEASCAELRKKRMKEPPPQQHVQHEQRA